MLATQLVFEPTLSLMPLRGSFVLDGALARSWVLVCSLLSLAYLARLRALVPVLHGVMKPMRRESRSILCAEVWIKSCHYATGARADSSS